MSADVVAIKGGPIQNERRDAFVQAVAASFDIYASRYGEEPDALVYVLCGARQASMIAWDIRGDSAGAANAVLSQAAVHRLTEAGATRREL